MRWGNLPKDGLRGLIRSVAVINPDHPVPLPAVLTKWPGRSKKNRQHVIFPLHSRCFRAGKHLILCRTTVYGSEKIINLKAIRASREVSPLQIT
jgi:hypothetical protein